MARRQGPAEPQRACTKLAAQANREHGLAQGSLSQALGHALEAGRALLLARDRIGHGNWLGWVRSNCQFSTRMAQNYMRLARSHESLTDEDAQRVSHLSIRSALQALSSPTAAAGERAESRQDVHYSSASDEWNTPQPLLDRAVKLLGAIDLDPCSNNDKAPNVPAALHYTIEDDGLSREWRGRVFLNPPYGRVIQDWTARLDESYRSGSVTEALALVPARTDARWFTELRSYPRCFVRGRLRFGDAKNCAPFPSAVFYLGTNLLGFAEEFGELGDVFALWRPSSRDTLRVVPPLDARSSDDDEGEGQLASRTNS